MPIKKALIIAAGNGSRLQSKGNAVPKPLQKVAGLPLIKRIILTAKKGGISEFVVVVGYQKEKIIKALREDDLGVKIEFVENPDWKKSNGLSVLAAKPCLRENFVLLMSDHVFDPQTLEKLRQSQLGKTRAWLAVDFKLSTVFDMDDATKVLSKNEQVCQIGKTLPSYNAVDTGMFLASPDLFDVLEEEKARQGDVSLSDGIQLLASRGQMGTFDIGSAFWQDVDTPASLKYAEKQLFNSCRKLTDGMISRNFNRFVSLWITRWLVKTNLAANHVTGFTSLVGIFSGFFMSQGGYWNGVIGALLFKLSSILDGCDGEMSKLKFSSSKVGQWLDTISDNVTYVVFLIGLMVGLGKSGIPHMTVIGLLTLLGFGMSFSIMLIYAVRNANSASLVAIQKDFEKIAGEGLAKKFFRSVSFMVKRDFFALLFLVLALANQTPAILWFSLIGSNITWMVLLSSKLGLFRPSHMVAKESPDPAHR